VELLEGEATDIVGLDPHITCGGADVKAIYYSANPILCLSNLELLKPD
jgi:hypothetical protein